MSEQPEEYEEIDVEHVPEPERMEEGFLDPEDTYVEGVDGEAGNPK
jgi:hypothetical protein